MPFATHQTSDGGAGVRTQGTERRAPAVHPAQDLRRKP